MRKPDIVMMVAGGLLSVWSCAAAAENPQPPPAMKITGKAMEPAQNEPSQPRLKARKQSVLPGDAVPRASRAPSKPLLPRLDEKNLGLGCSKP